MKKILIALLSILHLNSIGQQNDLENRFVKDFENAIKSDFSVEKLNKMFHNYNLLLTPHSDITQFGAQIQGHKLSKFPLLNFRQTSLYLNNIDTLLNSQNENQRILAYLVIASSGDFTKENQLMTKLKFETAKPNLRWVGMALLYLDTKHTNELFDFLLNNEEFGDAHMLPLYLKLNTDSLLQTAYSRINDDNPYSKILSTAILTVTPLNKKTEILLKNAVQNWDESIKGYAIYAISELQIGNLLVLLKPYVNIPSYKSIVFQALSNSPIEEDRQYLIEQTNSKSIVSEDLLESLYKSKNIESIKLWLKVITTKRLPSKYSFFTSEQKLLYSDEILSEVQNALRRIKNVEYLAELENVLVERNDKTSIDILISFLKNSNVKVRHNSALILRNKISRELENAEIKKLIQLNLNNPVKK